jgi:two-component system response regulator NreC
MPATRILIADENAVSRRGVRAVVEAESHWHVCAEVGEARGTVTEVRRLKPDVAIVSSSLSWKHGTDSIARVVKASPRTGVLVVSEHATEEALRSIFGAGAHGLILRSDSERDLVSAVASVGRCLAYVSPSVTQVVIDGFLGRANGSSRSGESLTPRERDILQLLAEGWSHQEIAKELGLQPKTVETHRGNIVNKIGVRSLSELVRFAIRNRIIDP